MLDSTELQLMLMIGNVFVFFTFNLAEVFEILSVTICSPSDLF